jgi:putative hemolysin
MEESLDNILLYVEIFAVVLLTFINGLLAMSELAVVSSRRSRLEQLGNQGNRGALAALRLIDDPSRFLSTVQVGITLVGIVTGAFSGITFGQRFGDYLNMFPWISPYGGVAGIGVTVFGMTYLSVVIGELVPKRIALSQPERVAALLARPMLGLSMVAAPVVGLLHVSSEWLLSALGFSGNRKNTITEEEVKSLIADGTQAGIFAPQEKTMIEGVLRLADRPVRVIMTPRPKIVWIDVGSERDEVLDSVASNRFSRLLVCNETIDRPIGFVHTKYLLPHAMRCVDFSLASLVTPLFCVHEHTNVLKLLNYFKKEKVHLAVVVDEHGATEGVVTLTDVIEAIAGELPEQGDDLGFRIVKREDGSWLVDGSSPTDEVEAVTGIELGKEIRMMAGFMLDHLGRIPEVGAFFTLGNVRFEVVDMDGNRIDKVLIRIQASPSDAEPMHICKAEIP